MGLPVDIPACEFNPWVGCNYQDGFAGGPRLLILGESHYGLHNAGNRGLTQTLTCEYAHGEWDHRFWTGIMQTVVGHTRAETDQGVCIQHINGGPVIAMNRESFWRSVSFYNYIQELLPGPGQAPPAPAWQAARPAFEAVLEALEPQALLILGVRLWNNLPGPTPDSGHQDHIYGPLHAGEVNGHAWVYQLPNGHEVLAAGTYHPSCPGFNWQVWHPVVTALCNAAAA